MKKYLLVFVLLSAMATCIWFSGGSSAQVAQSNDIDSPSVASTIAISQVYGGGGGSNGTYLYDYVELKNVSGSSQSLNGLSLTYGSSTGAFGGSGGTNFFALPNFTLSPGQYYLVQLSSAGSAGTNFPVPADASSTAISMSGSSGKIALVTSAFVEGSCGATATPCSLPSAAILDLVSYGASNNAEGNAPTNNGSALASTQGNVRKTAGCTDTDNNNADFDIISAPVPRNSQTTPAPCGGGGGGTLIASMFANPSTVAPGGTTLLTVTVTPATSPASTGISVVGNLSSLGGSSTQTFYDDGTNGDVTPADNVFSYSFNISAGTLGGTYNVSAVASDAQARTANANQSVTVNAGQSVDDPLLFGNPTNATSDIANENNYLMLKSPAGQYALSYSRAKETPNWVAWRLDSTWLGATSRQDDYRPDPALPAAWYHVTPTDYSEPVYDRGHMCPSGDRTRSVADNSATFLMTNFVPQIPDNNQGPWEDLESYCRTLVQTGSELYIISGPWGNVGTIGNGVVVPQWTWKVVLVLPNGNNDLQRVGKNARMFGVIMSNQSITRSAPWRNFRVTVDEVENLTHYDFFSNIPKNTQEMLERRHDTQ